MKFGVQNDGKQKQMNKTSNKTLAKNDTNSESETVKKEVWKSSKCQKMRREREDFIFTCLWTWISQIRVFKNTKYN